MAVKDQTEKTVKAFSDSIKAVKDGMDKLKQSIQNIADSMKKIYGFASEGMNNLAQVSSSTDQAFSDLKSSLLRLKNTLATVLAPAIEALTPAILFVMDTLSDLLTAFAKVSARLFGGSDTFLKAEETPAAGSDGGDAAAGDMFQETAIDPRSLALADSLRAELGELRTAAAFAGEAFRELFQSLEPLKTFAGTMLVNFYQGFLKPVGEWVLGTGLPRLAECLAALVSGIDWEKLNTAFAGLWEALAPFAVQVGEGLLWLFENILAPLSEWTMNEVVPRFLEGLSLIIQILSEAIELAQPALSWLWETFLSPLAEWAGTFLIHDMEFLLGVLQMVAGFLSGDMQMAADGAKRAFENLGKIVEDVFILILGQDAVEAIKGFLAEWQTKIPEWWQNDVLPWFSAEKWLELFENIKASFAMKLEELVAWWDGSFIKQFLEEHIFCWFSAEYWKNNLKGIVSGFKRVFVDAANGAIETVERAINWIIKKLNTLSWEVPEWVGGIGGETFGFNIAPIQIPRISVPKLATGAVIPPNAAFLAVLGDQRSGRNLEAPEGLVRQIVREEMEGANFGGDVVINASGDMGQMVRFMKFQLDKESKRRGNCLIKGVPAW